MAATTEKAVADIFLMYFPRCGFAGDAGRENRVHLVRAGSPNIPTSVKPFLVVVRGERLVRRPRVVRQQLVVLDDPRFAPQALHPLRVELALLLSDEAL